MVGMYNSIWVKKDTRGDDEASHQAWLRSLA